MELTVNSQTGTELDRQLADYQSLDLTPPPDWAAIAGDLAELHDLCGQESGDVHVVVPQARMEQVITQLHLAGGKHDGIFDRNFEDPNRYHAIADDVPVDRPYLIVGFEPGVEYLTVPPEQAVRAITARGRLPLTIHEGLAVFLHQPHTLQRNACWSLAGSTRGDRRVPALWISGRAPKLGWCFAGAPHTWLGTASVARRITLRPH